MDEPVPLYEIRIRGHLAARRLRHFEGLSVTHQATGETVLVGRIRDQSALYGVLGWLENMGLSLLSVRRLEAGEEAGPGRGSFSPTC